jgi:hypothetical protein
MLSEEQKRRYNLEIDASLSRARRRLAILDQRDLTAAQRTSLNRVRTFIAQAGALRQRDVGTAHALARRADALAEELIGSSR